MSKINFRDIKPFVKYCRGCHRFPVERMAIMSVLAKNPGITEKEIAKLFDLEISVIRTVLEDLKDAGKICFGLNGQIYLNTDYSNVLTSAYLDSGSVNN